MKSASRTLLILTTVVITIIVFAGVSLAETNFTGALHFNSGIPQGELSDQLDNNAYGIGGQIFYSPQKSPLAIGLDMSWMNYGSESRREPFSTTIPDVTVNVETNNNIVQAFFVLRGKMPSGPIRLYGDAMIGFNYMYTETKITDSDFLEDEVASSTNQDDAAFAYGVGGGIMIPIYTKSTENPGDHPFQIALDGGARYIFGGEAEYLKEGSIRRESTTVTFDTIKSKTDMVKIHVGVLVSF